MNDSKGVIMNKAIIRTISVILIFTLFSIMFTSCEKVTLPRESISISDLSISESSSTETQNSELSSSFGSSSEYLSIVTESISEEQSSIAQSKSSVSTVQEDPLIWYTQKNLTGTWRAVSDFVFSGTSKSNQELNIYLGDPSESPIVSFKITRSPSGKISVSAKEIVSDKTILGNTDLGQTEDTNLKIVLLNNEDSKRIIIRINGDKTFSGFTETEEVSENAFESIKLIGYPNRASDIKVQKTEISDITNEYDKYKVMALSALDDLYTNFWTGDSSTGHIIKEDHGYPTEGKQTMIWAHAMMLIGMEAVYDTTRDEDIKERIKAHWEFTKYNFNEEQMITPGRAPNIAADDAGWDAMTYMLFYRMTGDPYALNVAKKNIVNSYEYWKDGSLENGLWYLRNTDPKTNAKWKSIYSVGLMLASLDYVELTGDTEILQDTLKIYSWIEEYLLRDGRKQYGDLVITVNDNLYWADFNVNRPERTEAFGPDGGVRPNDIKEAGSVSFLGGNMAMAVIHAKLYKLTNEEKYLTRALETVRAVNDGVYNNKGVYLNDRDAWTTATFTRWWVKDVLILPGIQAKDHQLLKSTAESVFTKARTAKGYYGGSWSGPAEGPLSKWYAVGSRPEQIMTSANSCNMIFGAALLARLGY